MKPDHFELRQVLLTRLDLKKKANPQFSMRSYAKLLGLGAAEFSEFLRGIRRLSDKRASMIVEKLDLNFDEEERVLRRNTGILAGLPRLNNVELSQDQYQSISEWYHFAILSLAEIKNFNADPRWIATRLNISEEQAGEAVKQLLALGMLKKLSPDKVIASGQSYATTDGVPSATLRAAHRKNFELATQAMETVPLDQRDFRSVTVAIDPANLPEAKNLMAEFRDRLSNFLEIGEKKEVYKFCMQLFPLTTSEHTTTAKIVVGIFWLIFTCFCGGQSLNASGHSENGGGGVLVCENKVKGALPTVTMLDLWEAAVIRGKKIPGLVRPNTLAELDSEISRLLEIPSLNNELRKRLKWEAEFVLDQIRSPSHKLPSGVAIAPPLDGGNGFIGKACVLKGIALYDHVLKKLFVDDELFAQMSLTDRTALVLHEATYKVFRDWYFAENSLGARRFVGCLMESTPCKDLGGSIPVEARDLWHCVSTKKAGDTKEFSFEFDFNLQGSLNWRVTRIYGHPVATESIIPRPISAASLDTKHPLLIDGINYYPLIGFDIAERPLLLGAENGQSIPLRISTKGSFSGAQFQLDGTPIACRQ